MPQYLPSRRLANFCTAMMESGMSGTHTSSTTAVARLTGARSTKRVTGASTQ